MQETNDLIFLTESFNEKEAQTLLAEAIIRGKIKIYITDTQTDEFHQLKPGQIQSIKSNKEFAQIELRQMRTHCHTNVIEMVDAGHSQRVHLQDLLVSKSEANHLLKNKTDKAVTNFTTPLLDIQNKAIQKFWVNLNPAKPPKADEIISWLTKECGITKREAISIDLIIRPPKYKTGGNKRST